MNTVGELFGLIHDVADPTIEDSYEDSFRMQIHEGFETIQLNILEYFVGFPPFNIFQISQHRWTRRLLTSERSIHEMGRRICISIFNYF
jgi:hypothetical protein